MRRTLKPNQPLFRRTRRRSGRRLWWLIPLAALALAYLAWPYATLWRLDRAVRSDDPGVLSELVDLASVRTEIKRKLNKDARSRIGPVSDRFIRWLQAGIQDLGSDAVDRMVTLAWVREQLLAHSPGGASEGFLGEISFAFFEAPDAFQARIGPADQTAVRVHLDRQGLAWRIAAISH